MSDPLTTITLPVQWFEGLSDITTDPCAAQNADAVRLWTPDGELIAEWERRTGTVGRTWTVTRSDYNVDRDALGGYHGVNEALAAAVEWFRANCGVRSGVTIELS